VAHHQTNTLTKNAYTEIDRIKPTVAQISFTEWTDADDLKDAACLRLPMIKSRQQSHRRLHAPPEMNAFLRRHEGYSATG
jgi:hypothetical protein